MHNTINLKLLQLRRMQPAKFFAVTLTGGVNSYADNCTLQENFTNFRNYERLQNKELTTLSSCQPFGHSERFVSF